MPLGYLGDLTSGFVAGLMFLKAFFAIALPSKAASSKPIHGFGESG